MKKEKKTILFHPVLFGIFPILSFMASNINQARPELAYRSAVVSLVGCSLIYLIMKLVVKDTPRAALLATLFLVLFYSYGHVYSELETNTVLGLSLGRHRLMAPLWAVLMAAGAWWILKKGKDSWQFNTLLNAISVFALILPIYQISAFEYRYQRSSQAGHDSSEANLAAGEGSQSAINENLPDVYYIILDGYSRADVLKKLYGYDNTVFLKELEELGFVIPDCAQSNYARTALSMAATFHMDYLENFTDVVRKGDPSIDAVVFHDFIQYNPVRSLMVENGYQMVAFETGYFWNEVVSADYYIVGNDNPIEKVKKGAEVSEFELMFLRTTYFRIFSEAKSAFFTDLTKNIRTPDERHYDLVLFELDQLANVPSLPGKKYVYAHIGAPHAPFVFTSYGAFASTGSVVPGYTDEITFLNKRVIEVVKQILATSPVPPVIVIQADHGWDEEHRMEILNAYYLPNGGSELIYPEITPVNTFRVILNKYFGQNLPLIKDVSYFSDGLTPYTFTKVPATCVGPNGN
ncbi:MAG: hypothetical protein AB9891_11770 [Anaerolineaceae bacterium]